ncbi:MAG TPA: A24 family peptidase [archaeon]|nr:A24 family peptidase [archaeon]
MIWIEILLIREFIVILASAIAAYTDFKTGYIHDWITLPLIAAGLLLNLYEAQYAGIALGASVFAIGYILYYTGKIGGGDVKLFTGIALALPFYNGAVFIISAALFAAMSSVIFLSSFYTIKYLRKGIDFEYNKNGIRRSAILGGALVVYFYILISANIASAQYGTVLALPLLFGLVFMALEKGIRKEFFAKKIKLSEMEEDEIVALDLMEEDGKKISAGIKGVFGNEEKKKLEKLGIGQIIVYRNLPRFGPFILIGVVAALFLPQLFLLKFW